METDKYLMESDEESLRLLLKTDPNVVKRQAIWAGLKPGMRVADLGCGPGITSSVLHNLTQPNDTTVGVDFSEPRWRYAQEHYQETGLDFYCQDIRDPLENLGMFDFIWVRFVLEYYRSNSFDIVKKIIKILKPGGTLCLIDLDHNCLNHYGIPDRLESTVKKVMNALQIKANFDPYVGRKLYSYFFDLNFKDIVVDVSAHHNIYGHLKDSDEFNWARKVEIAPQKIDFNFNEYKCGYMEFIKEFKQSFSDPRRFTYTPIILCKGIKPI
jgi:SAM-dependent methyltransferase